MTAENVDSARTERDNAFAALVDRQAALMYRVAYSLLKHPEDAEDAVQETLLKLYRTGGWISIENERAFLARSVWRVGLNRLGTLAAKSMRHAEDVSEMQLASPASTPEQAALGSADHALMARLIDELPENMRQALVLSAIEEMRSTEVSAVLGIPEATVRTRVMRAKTELRRRFAALNSERGARR